MSLAVQEFLQADAASVAAPSKPRVSVTATPIVINKRSASSPRFTPLRIVATPARSRAANNTTEQRNTPSGPPTTPVPMPNEIDRISDQGSPELLSRSENHNVSTSIDQTAPMEIPTNSRSRVTKSVSENASIQQPSRRPHLSLAKKSTENIEQQPQVVRKSQAGGTRSDGSATSTQSKKALPRAKRSSKQASKPLPQPVFTSDTSSALSDDNDFETRQPRSRKAPTAVKKKARQSTTTARPQTVRSESVHAQAATANVLEPSARGSKRQEKTAKPIRDAKQTPNMSGLMWDSDRDDPKQTDTRTPAVTSKATVDAPTITVDKQPKKLFSRTRPATPLKRVGDKLSDDETPGDFVSTPGLQKNRHTRSS